MNINFFPKHAKNHLPDMRPYHLPSNQHISYLRLHSTEPANRCIVHDLGSEPVLRWRSVRMRHFLFLKKNVCSVIFVEKKLKRVCIPFFSSFLPHPMTVHDVPGLSSFIPAGGRHTGSRCSWKATRVASCFREIYLYKIDKNT